MRKYSKSLLSQTNSIIIPKNKTKNSLNPIFNSVKRFHFLSTENFCTIKTRNNYLNDNNHSINKKIDIFPSRNFSQLISQAGKLNYNLFIKENSKLEDLKFKEEIFEFVALKSNEMSEKDILTALNKLETHVILEAELKEFKFFIRNVLDIQEKFKNEFAIIKFIKYFLKTYNHDLKKFFDPNSLSIENNKYDLNFSNINASLLNFALGNLRKIESNANLKCVLDLLLLINFTDDKFKKEFLEKIQIKFLQNINLNLLNSPFNIKGIIGKIDSELDNDNNESDLKNMEIDLEMFLLMNLVIYQDNKFPLDETLKEILSYFYIRLSDKFGLLGFWDKELNKRPQIMKIESKELRAFNLIYGFMNNWVEAYKKVNKAKDNKDANPKKDENENTNQQDLIENNNKKNNNNNISSSEKSEINFIANIEQLETLEKLMRTIEKVVLRNIKITKQAFLKKFKNDSFRYKEAVNKVQEVDNKLMDKIISEMEKNI